MTSVSLPELPKGHEFEEFISAFYQTGGYYIERNLIERGIEEILELDIIVTDYNQSPPILKLVELKSGDWGFGDLFKLAGWLGYLNISDAFFIVQKERQNFEFFKAKAERLDIELIAIPDLKDTATNLSKFIDSERMHESDISVWRFSYWVERNLLKRLNHKKKTHKEMSCFTEIEKYYFNINNGIFFTENIVERLNLLYDSFRDSPHISAKCGHELMGENFAKEYASLPKKLYDDTFLRCAYTDIQISTFVEHRARLAILKSAVDLKLYRLAGEEHRTELYIDFLGTRISEFDFLPGSFISGLNKLAEHPYFSKYPVFWQNFMWLFGGFILMDYEEKEHELLSIQTGIPIDEIPNALMAYDILFPNPDGWFFKSTYSNIKVLKMFPVPFMGIGANYRRIKYTTTHKFEDLKLTGLHTLTDLAKWNNLAIEVLSSG